MPQLLHQIGPLQARILPAQTATAPLVLSFSSIGGDATRSPAPEFVASAHQGGRNHALFVADASRSFGNHPDFARFLRETLAAFQARHAHGPLTAIGLSMGGFMALVAAQILPIAQVLAFSPQFTLAGETRWQAERAALPQLLWPHAPKPDCPAYLLHGLQDDRAQALAFSFGTQLGFAAQSHASLVPHLKARGALKGLVEAAQAGDRRRLMRICASAGGLRRERW